MNKQLSVVMAEPISKTLPGEGTGGFDRSVLGHLWLKISNVDGTGAQTYGMQPEGVCKRDGEIYLEQEILGTLTLSEEACSKIVNFAEACIANNSVFGSYNAATNSCVDFVWTALRQIGILPIGAYTGITPEGVLLPVLNRQIVDVTFLTYSTNPTIYPTFSKDGNQFNNSLNGGAGKDTLSGLSGDDWLRGWDDDDCLNGGSGRDTLIGGAGNDWLGYKAAGIGNESTEERLGSGNEYNGGTGIDHIDRKSVV